MSDDFIDSNVLIYPFDNTDRVKRDTAERLVLLGLQSGSACISQQVVQETLNVITQKLKPRASEANARDLLTKVLVPLWRVTPTEALSHRGLDIQSRWRFSFYDSLIVAAALTAGCTRLYTEDLQHGQRIETLTITDPFRV